MVVRAGRQGTDPRISGQGAQAPVQGDANRARGDLRQLFTSGPDAVRQCIGCSLEQARTTISSGPSTRVSDESVVITGLCGCAALALSAPGSHRLARQQHCLFCAT